MPVFNFSLEEYGEKKWKEMKMKVASGYLG